MTGIFARELSSERIDEILGAALEHAEAGSFERAWQVAKPLIKAQRSQVPAAKALVQLLEQGAFADEHALECANALFDAHRDHHPGLVGELGDALESVHDITLLNAAPPSDPLYERVASHLRDAADSAPDDQLLPILSGLATVSRLLGRGWDDVAEHAYRRRIDVAPEQWPFWYGLGLFYKTRGRFAEGLAANQRAFELGGSDQDSVLWNLGICATGARDGQAALQVWTSIGQKLTMGRFDLPDGKYGQVKVRLAEHPLAERNPALGPDHPGDEETIWIERLSPCHGIVQSALLYDSIGVDFGDVVLFDGAPITHHTYGDDQVPVFPHLATLVRGDHRIFRFAGTQRREHQIAHLSEELPDGAVFYVHTEQAHQICSSCWSNPGVDHADHTAAEHRVVAGKLCAPPSVQADQLLAAVDRLLSANADVRLFIPDLAEAAGQPDRAAIERRRTQMLDR